MKTTLPWLLPLLLATAPAIAGDVLQIAMPQGPYFDDDSAALHFSAPPGGRARFRQMLNAAIHKYPKNPAALAHRAYLFHEGGDEARAQRDFDAALVAAVPGSPAERHVRWSRGWLEYDEGDLAAALSDWRQAVALHGGRPFWAPYSFALLYWTGGEPDVALAWYGAAVASNPQWGIEAGFDERTRSWTAAQRNAMRALFDAWRDGRAPRPVAGAPMAP